LRYKKINPQLFIDNRKKFSERMEASSLAIFHSNDILPTNADGNMPFMQNKDLFYLTGIDQEETVLLLFPDSSIPKFREILFLKETNEHIARWEGEKLSKRQAFEVSGIQNVQWVSELPKLLRSLAFEADNLYLNQNEHLRSGNETETREERYAKQYKQMFPLHTFKRSAPILHYLRSIKHGVEMELMLKSAQINTMAYHRVLKAIKPGVKEYELQAEFIHQYLISGAQGFSYEPIIASGANACILHYIENNATCKEGELILFDVGCWYANYASDVSRCFPVSGVFTPRQKEVYNAVLRVQKACFEILKPGVMLHDYHKQVGDLMTDELLQLGLISQEEVATQNPEWPAYKKYFMHGTSHFLGLDVHDVGLWHKPVEEGMVFTIEPGIYIPEENLGIRIEDNIIITHDGHINLTESIPKEVEEIEAFMAQ